MSPAQLSPWSLSKYFTGTESDCIVQFLHLSLGSKTRECETGSLHMQDTKDCEEQERVRLARRWYWQRSGHDAEAGHVLHSMSGCQQGVMSFVLLTRTDQGDGQTHLAACQPFGHAQVRSSLSAPEGPHHSVWKQAPCSHSHKARHSSCLLQLTAGA